MTDTADPPEFLDVDVNQLTRPGALIAHRLLESDPPEAADPRGWSGSRETVESGIASVSRDLGRGHPQLPQLHDHCDPLGVGAVCDTQRRGRPVEQPEVELS